MKHINNHIRLLQSLFWLFFRERNIISNYHSNIKKESSYSKLKKIKDT